MTLGNRSGVLKLQDAALASRFDAVLVTDLSRLSRSQGDFSKMIDRPVAKALAVMPRAAELHRRRVALGLDGNPQAAQKARVFSREWFGGKIRLEPLGGGGLMAHWNQNIGALVCAGIGTFGSGGVIWTVPSTSQSVKLK